MRIRADSESEWKGRSGAPMPRVAGGDERGGFEILVDKGELVVHMKLWGIWHLPLAREFYSSVTEIGHPFGNKPWAIIADSRLFGAQSPDVSRLRQEAMAKARALGCDKIAAIADKVVYAMQFKRIAEESHVGSGVFATVDDALVWVREQRKGGKK
jgi:hypothetical protein